MDEPGQALSRVDTAWLRMDGPHNLMMIVGVWLLTPALDHRALCERMQQRLLVYPRFRQKVVQQALQSFWVEDEHFAIEHHVVRETLVRRRGRSQQQALQARAAALATTPLDPSRPLWQLHLVERYGQGSALILRVHHCIGDGIALSAVLMSVADDGPDLRPPAAAEAAEGDPDENHHAAFEGWLEPLTARTVQAIDLTGDAMVKALDTLAHPRRSLHEATGLADAGVQLAHDALTLALLPDDSPTRLKGPLEGRKAVAWCEPVPLDQVKAVGKALGASVNDVLLSCVAGAIGHHLRERGDDTAGQEIRAMVPVNLRPLSEAWRLGNRFGLVGLVLPIGIDNPIERLGVVRQRMRELKGSYQPLLSYALLAFSGLLPQALQTALNGVFLRKTTAVMTNVPGPTKALTLCGSILRQSIVWVPASGEVGVGVSIVSYAGGVQFGLVTDRRRCPDPQRVIDRFTVEFEQLTLLTLMLPWGQEAAA